MNYQVLALKWRPRSFQTLVGQEPTRRILSHALEQNRLHHAYLFTGTRGVGKTTIARIFAKCLNCEAGVTATPCGLCNACQEIDSGRFIDLLEIDAASRTRVEDTRELLDNVPYAPSKGRYKVYLIDEVHMLSGHSFNALLKTLEEPPAHVKFLLATTDPQRLPITVLSRCLQLHLSTITPIQISQHLQMILQQEGIAFEETALSPIANAAKGSLRDALSLLDQAIAYGNGSVNTQDVNAMLGTIEQHCLYGMMHALIEQDANALMAQFDNLASAAADFEQTLAEILGLLHQIAVAQQVPLTTSDPDILDFAKRISLADVQLFYQIALMGRRDLPYAATPRDGFEMTLLRMLAFCPSQTVTDLTQAAQQNPTPTTVPAITPITSQTPTRLQQATVTAATTSPPTVALAKLDWVEVIAQLSLSGVTLVLANHCILQDIDDQHIHLLLDPSQATLLNSKQQERLTQALSQYFKKPMQLHITLGNTQQETPAAQQKRNLSEQQIAAEQAIHADPHLQTLVKNFDAKIIPGSIKPTNLTVKE